jgi:hypothetical protein
MPEKQPSQLDKFKEAARQIGIDDDPKRFKERVGKLVKLKPVEKPESSSRTSRFARAIRIATGAITGSPALHTSGIMP